MYPDHLIDFLQIIRDDRHGRAVSQSGEYESTGLFADERATSLWYSRWNSNDRSCIVRFR